MVVHAAGVAGGGFAHLLGATEWERVVGINLTGTFLVDQLGRLGRPEGVAAALFLGSGDASFVTGVAPGRRRVYRRALPGRLRDARAGLMDGRISFRGIMA